MPRPRIPLRLGALDQEYFELSRGPEDQRHGCFRVTLTWFGLPPVLRTAGEEIFEFTQPSVRDFHSNAPGVGLPNMLVELRLESDRKSVLENPVGQIE